MLDTLFTLDPLFWIVVGTFVGWNLPQPSWAKKIQNKAVVSIGLNEGDVIVTNGFINLFDGANVTVK